MASAVCLLFFSTQQYEQQVVWINSESPTNYTSLVFAIWRLDMLLQDNKQHYSQFKQQTIMNIFAGLQVYAGKWNVTDSRSFNDEEKAMISRAEVVASE